jgi:hypothetical protein
MFHTHPSLDDFTRSKIGVIYEFPSSNDLIHFIHFFNNGKTRGSITITNEGIYNTISTKEETISEETPESLQGKWDLVRQQRFDKISILSLPDEIEKLALDFLDKSLLVQLKKNDMDLLKSYFTNITVLPYELSLLASFLNENERIDEIPNLREEFFRTLLDRETMETKDFLFVRSLGLYGPPLILYSEISRMLRTMQSMVTLVKISLLGLGKINTRVNLASRFIF